MHCQSLSTSDLELTMERGRKAARMALAGVVSWVVASTSQPPLAEEKHAAGEFDCKFYLTCHLCRDLTGRDSQCSNA